MLYFNNSSREYLLQEKYMLWWTKGSYLQMLKIKQKNWLAKKISKQTPKEVKNFGTVIYKEFDKVCKEWLGKSFGEVISLVPEAGLTK